MSQPQNERSPSPRTSGNGRQGGSTGRRRLEILELANGGIFLLAVGLVAVSSLPSPSIVTLAGVAALLLCCAIAWWLRRRFHALLAAELQRHKRTEQAARAGEFSKDRLLAELGHEIRNPMGGILGMADLLLLDELTPAQREKVSLIRSSAESLLVLVNSILDLSRIEAGRLVLRPRDFSLRELTGDLVRLLATRAAEREVELLLDVAPALPDQLHGDPVRLRQVLLNLIGNAIRFTRKGTVTITVEPAESQSGVRYEVRDTGAGIRPELQARLFEPFTQAESSGGRPSVGTGLGLVISKNLVELMGGEIGFESARGVGSTFWFRLPLRRAEALREP
jgi:two-component system, sensor histidine kinase